MRILKKSIKVIGHLLAGLTLGFILLVTVGIFNINNRLHQLDKALDSWYYSEENLQAMLKSELKDAYTGNFGKDFDIFVNQLIENDIKEAYESP